MSDKAMHFLPLHETNKARACVPLLQNTVKHEASVDMRSCGCPSRIAKPAEIVSKPIRSAYTKPSEPHLQHHFGG